MCSSVSCLKGEDWDDFIQVKTKPNSPNLKPNKSDIPNTTDASPSQDKIPKPVSDPEPPSAEESMSEAELQPKQT